MIMGMMKEVTSGLRAAKKSRQPWNFFITSSSLMRQWGKEELFLSVKWYLNYCLPSWLSEWPGIGCISTSPDLSIMSGGNIWLWLVWCQLSDVCHPLSDSCPSHTFNVNVTKVYEFWWPVSSGFILRQSRWRVNNFTPDDDILDDS